MAQVLPPDKQLALQEYAKKIREHNEVEAKVRECVYFSFGFLFVCLCLCAP